MLCESIHLLPNDARSIHQADEMDMFRIDCHLLGQLYSNACHAEAFWRFRRQDSTTLIIRIKAVSLSQMRINQGKPLTHYLCSSMANNIKYEELVKKQPAKLVEKIVTEVANKDTVEVYFEDEDDELRAVLKIHDYDQDNEMSLRLLSDSKWVLQFGYYDDEDEFIELLQPLAQAEIDLIPKGLQKVMLKVVAGEEGLRVPGKILSA
jgi:hypothetical protein